MHVLFVHKNFPAQFGHIAAHLVQNLGWQCSFVCELSEGVFSGIRRLQYKIAGGATAATHYCSRTFENSVWHAHAVYETMRAHSEIRPDLIVGHSGFGSTVFLADLYNCPIINYFEYYYRGRGSDMDFRPEFPARPIDVLRARTRNAMILVDLQTCAAAYVPTEWQRSLFPEEYTPKLETIFDGIDTTIWQRRQVPRRLGDRAIDPETRIVTYVSRGFEAMRGFDIFMKVAKRIYEARPNVVFACIGSDRTCYGGDERHIKAKTFRAHVLAQDDYDLSKFWFPGAVPPADLAGIFSLSDLHIYLTVPFVLSWSLMNALSCGCTVLASDTPPVKEMIVDGENGLLAGFNDVETLAANALAVLDDPAAHRLLGARGAAIIRERYSLEVTLPHLLKLFERTLANRR